MANCNNCYWGCFQDYGYSDYTVEGSDFLCILNQHPNAPFDACVQFDPKFDFAEECSFYKEGETLHVSVEGETYGDAEQEKAYLNSKRQL